MQISSRGSPGSCACHFRPQGVAVESSAGTTGENATNLAQSWACLLFPSHLLSFLRSCCIIIREQVLGVAPYTFHTSNPGTV